MDEECVWHNAVNAKIFTWMKSLYGLCYIWWNDSAEIHDVTESCSLSLIGMQQPLKCLVSIPLPDDEVSFEFGCTTWTAGCYIHSILQKQWHCKVLRVYSNISSVKCKLVEQTYKFEYPNLKTLLNKECALSFVIRLSSETLDSMLE